MKDPAKADQYGGGGPAYTIKGTVATVSCWVF